MTTDACATPGCGHPTTSHSFGYGDCGWLVAKGSGTTCPCTAYLPPRPVPEEGDYADALVEFMDSLLPRSAPHAEAEAAWEEFFRLHHNSLRLTVEELRREAFIAGYLRGRGDRG